MSLPRRLAALCGLGLVVCLTGHALVGSVPAVGTNQWAAGPALNQARAGATATSIGDDNVLVTGGRGAAGPLASVELLTSSGTAVPVAPMSAARAEHAAALVGDGQVLVAGGTTVVTTEEGTAEAVTGSVEVFDLAAAIWYPVGALSHPRAGATAVALPEGRVAIVGGHDASGPVVEIEIYDPIAGGFVPGGATSQPRDGAAVASTRDGHIVVVGGSVDGIAQATADIIDPIGGIVATVTLTSPRTGASATTTVEDQILIAGGSDGTTTLATTEVLDPVTGNSASGATLGAARADHRAFLLPHNGGVLLVGGNNADGLVSASELIIPWVNATQATPPVADPRSKTAGAAGPQDGVFVVTGGSTAAGAPSASSDYYGFATVKTDKDDYAPGEFVTITGGGWQPGETVNLVLREVGTGAADTPLNAVVEADGTFLNDFWAPNESHLGVRFYLTAVGAGATAQTTFTDGQPQQVTLTPTTRTVTAGDSATYTADVNMVGNPDACTINLEITTALPAGAGASFNDNPSAHNPGNVPFSRTLTISTTAATPPGTYSFTVRATRVVGSGCQPNAAAGGTGPTTTGTLEVQAGDDTGPITAVAVSPLSPNGTNGWYVTDVHVTVAATDNVGGSGVAETRCVLDPAVAPATFEDIPVGCAFLGAGADVTSDGMHFVYAASKDNAGNIEAPVQVASFQIDKTKPTGVVVSPDRAPDANGWYNASFTATWTGADATSGIFSCTQTEYSGPDTTGDTLSGTCTDNAGNVSDTVTFNFKYDATAPFNVAGAPNRAADSNGWYNHAVDVVFTGDDATWT